MQRANPTPRKRFYTTAQAAPAEEGYHILLDGRTLKTPASNPLMVPYPALAQAIAEEWAGQGDILMLDTLALTKLANTAIDGVSPDPASVVEEITRYGASDAVCYRAASPQSLGAAQERAWKPVIEWAGAVLGTAPNATAGVTFCEQPAAYVGALREHVSRLDPFRLTALHTLTVLSGSALIALMHTAGRLDRAQAWAAAHIDEDWQIAQWGEDYEARRRRERRFEEFAAASRFHALACDTETRSVTAP